MGGSVGLIIGSSDGGFGSSDDFFLNGFALMAPAMIFLNEFALVMIFLIGLLRWLR